MALVFKILSFNVAFNKQNLLFKMSKDITPTPTTEEEINTTHDNVALFFDNIFSNPHKWRFFGLYLVIQCVTGLSLVLVLLVNEVGRAAMFLVEALITYYFGPGEKMLREEANNTTMNCPRPLQYFGVGQSISSLLILLFFCTLAKGYTCIKARYFQPREEVYT